MITVRTTNRRNQMSNFQQDAAQVIKGYTSEVYDSKDDAIIVAHHAAKHNGYCFAVEGRFGWHASLRKPTLRSGRVIECRDDGKEYIA